MIPHPMLDNIVDQPSSLRQVLDYHSGAGCSQLLDCAECLRDTRRRIVVTGMGASFFAALPAVYALEGQGRLVQATESAELLHYGSAAYGGGDTALLISRSGGSVEVLRLAERMQQVGVATIGITNVAGSPLTRITDRSLIVGSAPDELIAVQSYTGTLLALLLLAEHTAPPGQRTLAQQTESILPLLERFIQKIVSEANGFTELLGHGATPYLLGRGAALATVYEGGLLFHETAKAAAVSMSSGQFRHGPVEVVAKGLPVFLIGGPAATRHLDWSLASDLRLMGAQVYWIGPTPGDTDAPLSTAYPDVPEALMPIFDIVPLQVAAYSLALTRDLVPGQFRYASEVTQNETGFPLLQGGRQ